MSVNIICGDALTKLRELPSNHFHCCVTSPPYYGLRDYQTGSWEGGDQACDHRAPNHFDYPIADKQASHCGSEKIACYRDVCGKCGARRVDQQIGLESSPEEWCARLVEVFHEVRRVLRSDGVMFLNCGDSYAASTKGAGGNGKQHTNRGSIFEDRRSAIPAGLKPKDLIGAPWMLAFALRADGWWLRSDSVWSKPNPMPESINGKRWEPHRIKDEDGEWMFCPGCPKCEPNDGLVLRNGSWRPTKSHEYVFMLSKSDDYFGDAEAVREPASESVIARAAYMVGGTKSPQERNDGGRAQDRSYAEYVNGRNLRSVWTIATDPLPSIEVDGEKLDHFASYPVELARRCILAGTSAKGCCPDCGAPWARVVEREGLIPSISKSIKDQSPRIETIGWRPTCLCVGWDYVEGIAVAECEMPPVPCRVIDPFGGSGRTALAAEDLGRDCTLIELNPASVKMARAQLERTKARRMIGDAKRVPAHPNQLGLFE